MDHWHRYSLERRFRNPKLASQTWYNTDADRRERYLKLRALGYAQSTARRMSSPNFRHEGDSVLAANRAKGTSYDISLPSDIRSLPIQDKVRIALALLGESRLRALSEDRPSLEAELVGEAEQVENAGGDVNRHIEDRINSLRREARFIRSSVPLERPVRTIQGTVIRELPAHIEESPMEKEEQLLEHLEAYVLNVLEQDAPDISSETKNIITSRALESAKSLIRQGVHLDQDKILELASDARKIITSELSKLKETVRADNPSSKNVKDVVKCFSCDRVIPYQYEWAFTSDRQKVYVGSDCFRRIVDTQKSGYQPPKGGPRLFCREDLIPYDNPSKTYYLQSTRTDKFPFKKIEGKADFVQLMVVASKAAQNMGVAKPKDIKDAIKLLDKAGFRVAEVK